MDLSEEEEETEAAPIETSKSDHLSDALSSFYSDLATMDGPIPGGGGGAAPLSQETTPIPTPPQVKSPAALIRENSPASLSDERSSSPLSFGETPEERRKRKTKISAGLSMKKKNVGSLVAKWQNIQQEVKRNQ